MGLTEDAIAAYRNDGVVHLPGAVDADLVAELIEAVDASIAEPSRRGGSMTAPDKPGMFFQDRHLFPHRADFRRLLYATPLARLAAEAMGSETIRIYFDHIFVKDVGTDDRFVWHQDRPYWAVDGTQICSTWVALTAADAASSALEFVRGSHRWDTTFRPEYPALEGRSPEQVEAALWPGLAEHLRSFEASCPAFEDEPDRYEILSFDVEPGDALLFDFRTVHRSGPNAGTRRRAAVSWRWLGDDARWAPTVGADPIIGPDDTFLQPGDLITDDEVFPVLHPAPA